MNSVAVWYIEDEDGHLTEDKPFTEARACGTNSIEAGGNYCHLWGETSFFFALFFFFEVSSLVSREPWRISSQASGIMPGEVPQRRLPFSVCLSTFPWNNLADVEQKLHRPQWNGSESRGFVKAAADGTKVQLKTRENAAQTATKTKPCMRNVWWKPSRRPSLTNHHANATH